MTRDTHIILEKQFASILVVSCDEHRWMNTRNLHGIIQRIIEASKHPVSSMSSEHPE